MERNRGHQSELIKKISRYRIMAQLLLALAVTGCSSTPPIKLTDRDSGAPVGVISGAEGPLQPPPGSQEGGTPPPRESTAWVRFEPDGRILFNLQGFRNGACNPPDEIPQDLAEAIITHFGAERLGAEAAVVAWSENGRFDPQAAPTNTDGSGDYGYMQINSVHFPKLQARLGISDMRDLFNADLNLAAARIVYDDNGGSWNPWYGPKRVNCEV